MGYILYYSNYCIQCQKLLQFISKTDTKKKIHFICIDARKTDEEGNLIVVLENGQNLIVPPNITRVPALIIIPQNNRVLFGCEEIKRYFAGMDSGISASLESVNQNAANPYIKTVASMVAAAPDPTPYVLNAAVGCGTSGFGVTSDNYSYYNMTPEELSTKGNGGTRQMHNYVSVHHPTQQTTIYTPEETYKPDKVGDISLEQLQQMRNADINMPSFTPNIPPPRM